MDTFVTSIEEVGRAAGLQEAREEGREEGQRTLVFTLLQAKLGTLAPDLRERVQRLDAPQIQTFAVALLGFETVPDLVDWLDRQGLPLP